MYNADVRAQYLAAQDATNGYLLNRKSRAAGVDPATLLTGPAHIAYACASKDRCLHRLHGAYQQYRRRAGHAARPPPGTLSRLLTGSNTQQTRAGIR
ncbi:hypothetical protein [Streptomyces sp. NPDC046197]|uniref:hypothetical protein n=1 Tax=Streptomyces sp. NPDC046197 TaxID=3154337 RepID=UPI0033EB88E7